MSKVMIEVTEQTALRLLSKSSEQQISVASFLERIAIELESKSAQPVKNTADPLNSFSIEKQGPVRDSEWFHEAVKRVKAIDVPGTTFSLRTLFSPEEWDQLPSPRVFGRLFREAIEPMYATRDGDDEEWNIAKYVRNATK